MIVFDYHVVTPIIVAVPYVASLLEQINSILHTQYATIHLENVFLYTALRSSELISFHLSGTTVCFYLHAQAVIIALPLNLNIVFKELDNLKGYHADLLYWWYHVGSMR